MKKVELAKKIINKKFLFGLICILFLILLGFLVVRDYSNLNKNLKIRNASTLDIIDQRINSIFLEINNFPGNAANEIIFLSKLSCFKDVINNEEGSELKINGVKNIEKDFLEFLKQSSAYYQLRYIDKNGSEIVRVDFDGENYKVIPKSKLQDKSWRYYFNQAMGLDEGEVYISPLDLNIENGEIENRGTERNPVYVPVIRYATPVVNNEGGKEGIIITNIYADYFLEDIRRFQREGEEVFLINGEGHYLTHPDKRKEFGFMLDKDNTFYKDYTEVSEEILQDFSKRRLETKDYIFSFRHIYPTIGSFEIYEGSKKVFGKNSEESYYWTLVSVSEKKEIEKATNNLKETYIFSMVFSGVIISTIAVLAFVLVFKYRSGRVRVKRKKRRSILNLLKLKK